jgi:uncharacterized protein (TIGR02231 family)
MRRLLPATLGLVVFLSVPVPMLAAPAETLLVANSRISAVTVYPDRARITRTARFDVAPGTYVLRFDRLPVDLQADSLRVRGEGSARVLIHGFDLNTVYLGQSPDKEVAGLESQLVALGDRDRALADQRAIHERQLAVLIQTAEQAGTSLDKQLAAGKAKLDEWQKLMAFLASQQATETKALQTIDQQRRTLANQRKAIEAQLAKLRGFRRERVRQVPVTVEVKEGGSLNLALEYVMPGARWYPSYDARLTPAGDKLSWGYYGVIAQQTGEDWSDVKLKLSTAIPSAGGQPPAMPQWFLYPYQPQAKPGRARRNEPTAGAVAPAPVAEAAKDEAEQEAEEPQTTVESQGTSVTLEVPREVTIPSDGEPHQTPVGRSQFATKPAYYTVPRLSELAYLEVEATHGGPWPILPGAVKAFVGQDFVGTSQISSEISPDEKFTLAMGADRALQVKRQRLSKQQGQSGLLQKFNFAEYTYEVTIANNKPGAQLITVVEPLPQSTDQDVKVQLLDTNHKPMADSQPGEVKWQLKLAPHEKKVLHWGYRVEYPLGVSLSGLE